MNKQSEQDWGDKELTSDEVDRIANDRLKWYAIPLAVFALIIGAAVAGVIYLFGGDESLIMAAYFATSLTVFLFFILHVQLLLAIVAESYKIRHGIRD